MASSELDNSSSLQDEYCSHCTQACSSIDFVVTPSSVLGPNAELTSVIKYYAEQQNFPLPENWSTNWESEIANNFVGLEVVCQSFLVENMTQKALISLVDVLSGVGGQAGLWIGISFLSIMELIEMLFRLVRHQFQAIRGDTTRRVATNER